MKINIGSFKLDLRSILTAGIPYGLAMYSRMGLEGAFVSGFIFGSIFAFVFAIAKMMRPKKQTIPRELVIELPRALFYMFAVGFWFFLALLILSLIAKAPTGILFIPIFLIVVCLYGYFSEARQIQISETEIIVRKGIVKVDTEKRYKIRDIQGLSLKWWGGLVATFRNQQKVTLYPYCAYLSSLPPSKENGKNEMQDMLLRLKDELERRKINSQDLINSQLSEFRPVGFKPIWTTGVVVIGLLSGILYHNYNENLKKISVASQTLRQNDFEKAFELYKGSVYPLLREKYRQACAEKKDFNCRLHSYFLSMEGNEKEALSFAKMSCSKSDPQSCYVVFVNEKANSGDRKPASELLDSICEADEYKSETCCTCYKEASRKSSSKNIHD